MVKLQKIFKIFKERKEKKFKSNYWYDYLQWEDNQIDNKVLRSFEKLSTIISPNMTSSLFFFFFNLSL